jgi:ribosomal protein S18 acetylase RimI-like enzyme
MARPLNHETSAALTRSNRTRPITPEDAAGAAEAFAGAYEHSPDRALCPEVADAAQAADFLERVASSAFGPSSLEYLRVAPAPDEEDGPLAGAAAGAEPAAGVGFILHVAVRPAYRGRGVGTALVAETCEAFRQAGLTQAGLGVSEENPARRIYERLGFRTKRQLMAYVWNPAS